MSCCSRLSKAFIRQTNRHGDIISLSDINKICAAGFRNNNKLLRQGGFDLEAKVCRVLLRIYENGNITRTAEELGYTQAGISMMIKKEEENCGFKLLSRGPHGVEFTSAGRELLPVMREVVKWDEHLDQLVSSVRGIDVGTVRIGCYSSIAYHLMPNIIRHFYRDYPNIRVEIIEGGSQEITKWVAERRTDIGFLSSMTPSGFEALPLVEDRIMALLPKSHPLAGGKVFPLEAFGNETLVLPTKEYDPDSYNVIEAYKDRFGKLPSDIHFSCTDAYAIISMVANGIGVSVQSGLMLRGQSESIAVLDIDPVFERTLIMCFRSKAELSPAAAKFAEYARKYASEGLLKRS